MKILDQDIEMFCPTNTEDWRDWLINNHEIKESVWMVYYKKHANMPTVNWTQAVDEALCFGWIDSIGKPIDKDRFMQFFSKRKAKSTWSKINKDKIIRLTLDGKMAPAGQRAIDIAKENGSWEILDTVEALIIPEDLELAFGNEPAAALFYDGLSKSVKKAILQWLVLARKKETRQNRIKDVVRFCLEGWLPKSIRP
jgi:uncharacterized protein YdeI (YjbR/CyaY-like superfamily)